ncbi:MAG: hypothetical protein R3F59_37555 [Myxococcota bacterium]
MSRPGIDAVSRRCSWSPATGEARWRWRSTSCWERSTSATTRCAWSTPSAGWCRSPRIFPDWFSLVEGLRELDPEAKKPVLDRARALVREPDAQRALWMIRALDTADSGISVFSGVSSAVKLYRAKTAGERLDALGIDTQQGVDAVMKGLALAFVVYSQFPGSLTEKVAAFRATTTGQALVFYYAALEVGLPFADNALLGGGAMVKSLFERFGPDQQAKLAAVAGPEEVEQAVTMMGQLMGPIETMAGMAKEHLTPDRVGGHGRARHRARRGRQGRRRRGHRRRPAAGLPVPRGAARGRAVPAPGAGRGGGRPARARGEVARGGRGEVHAVGERPARRPGAPRRVLRAVRRAAARRGARRGGGGVGARVSAAEGGDGAGIEQELAAFPPTSVTCRVLAGMMLVLPGPDVLPPYGTIDQAADLVFGGLPDDLRRAAHDVAAEPRVARAMFAARSIDTGDTGLTIVSGVRSAVALVLARGDDRLAALAQQQRASRSTARAAQHRDLPGAPPAGGRGGAHPLGARGRADPGGTTARSRSGCPSPTRSRRAAGASWPSSCGRRAAPWATSSSR